MNGVAFFSTTSTFNKDSGQIKLKPNVFEEIFKLTGCVPRYIKGIRKFHKGSFWYYNSLL